jgi:hypothetical protein
MKRIFFVYTAVQHERGPRKAKPKILSVSSMILPASTMPTAPPVACSSSPTMGNVSTISLSNQFNRKSKHSAIQQQLSCLPTMDNYNPFSNIINQVIKILSPLINPIIYFRRQHYTKQRHVFYLP